MVKLQTVKVVKQGNSKHIILPSWYCKENDIKKGDDIDLMMNQEGNLIISKSK